jgi:four helix bundle protein
MRKPLKFEELRTLQAAETVADAVWRQVVKWEPFAREVVGVQLTWAVDSIGANIAESYGLFHYGKKLQLLYYARGSLFEAKYWLNRALARQLMPSDQVTEHVAQLNDLARQLNTFGEGLKAQRRSPAKPPSVREPTVQYDTAHSDGLPMPAAIQALMALESITEWSADAQAPRFGEAELPWLPTIPDT